MQLRVASAVTTRSVLT